MACVSYGTIVIPEEKLPLLLHANENDVKIKLLGVQKTSFYLGSYVFLYVLFLCSGAAIFSLLEVPMEFDTRLQLSNTVSNFKRMYPNVTDQALEDLISEVVKAHKRGVSALRNATVQELNWSFGQSFFFTSTVVTTIGYGHVTPLSRSGKIFCIMYAVVGIPLTLVLLSALVERLLVPTLILLRWFNTKLGDLYEPFKIRILHLFVIILILVVFFILLPAAIFAYIEPDWGYLDSIYYCFISLTTIGLGDFIPGDSTNQKYRPFYKILTTVYLFLGVTYMMLALAVFYDIPQLNLGVLFSPSVHNASENVHLAISGQSYNTTTEDLAQGQHRQVVRVRSRRQDEDDDSPEEKTYLTPRMP